MSIYGWFQGKGDSGFGYNSTAAEVAAGLDLSGRTYLLTGCNSGLGLETMRALTDRGATVIGAARSIEKATAAGALVPGTTLPVACDLSEPASVRAAVEAVRDMAPLDGIIANAGIMALPKRTLQHGIELQLLTNHIGHFILVTGLLDRLTSDGRVVMVSSSAHRGSYREGIRLDDFAAERGYRDWLAYGQSKLANVLFARELARRLPAPQTANALHPGVIPTNLTRHIPSIADTAFKTLGPVVLTKTIPQGAATQTWAAVHPGSASERGAYFVDCNPGPSSRHARSDELAEQLWTKTEEVVAGL